MIITTILLRSAESEEAIGDFKLLVQVGIASLCGITVLLSYLIRFRNFNYFRKNPKNFVTKAVLILHILASLISAMLLPNNYLVKYPYFGHLYETQPIFIPLTVFAILNINLLIGGFILSGIAALIKLPLRKI